MATPQALSERAASPPSAARTAAVPALRRRYAAAARWLLAAFPAGVAAELLLGLICSQAF